MTLALLYITCPSKEVATDIARTLLAERLIACANLTANVTSFYRWQGELEESHECVIVAKTTQTRAGEAIARAGQLHPYDTPAIVALPVGDALPEYAEWVKAEVA